MLNLSRYEQSGPLLSYTHTCITTFKVYWRVITRTFAIARTSAPLAAAASRNIFLLGPSSLLQNSQSLLDSENLLRCVQAAQSEPGKVEKPALPRSLHTSRRVWKPVSPTTAARIKIGNLKIEIRFEVPCGPRTRSHPLPSAPGADHQGAHHNYDAPNPLL